MKYLRQLSPEKISGKRCLLRLNLDVKKPDPKDFRLVTVISTIKFLLAAKVLVTVIGHRGRPQTIDPALSVKPVVDVLSQLVGQPLTSLENIRFDPRELQNDKQLAQELTTTADFFVNDDFGTAHHRGASYLAITDLLPSYAGFRFEEEVATLTRISTAPEKPFVLIIGGIKADDKLKVVASLGQQADNFLMGSAYIGLNNSELHLPKVMLPEDWIGEGDRKLDIGPKTIERFSKIISQAKTIVWGGPLGNFEDGRYRKGSEIIAQAIASSKAFSMVGGGDTTEMLELFGMMDKFSFMSTGGGAMFQLLAGKNLPAIEALNTSNLNI